MTDAEKLEPTVVGAAWRYKLLVLAWILIAVTIVGAYMVARPDRFEGTSSIVVTASATGDVSFGGATLTAERYVSDQAILLRSPSVAARAEAILGDAGADGRSVDVEVGSSPDDSKLEIRVAADSIASGQARVGAVLQAYGALAAEQASQATGALDSALQREISGIDETLQVLNGRIQQAAPDVASGLQQERTQLLQRRTDLQQRADDLSLDAEIRQSRFIVTDGPRGRPVPPARSALELLALAVILGLVGGVAHAYARSARRRQFEHRLQPQQVLGSPLIAEIPTIYRSKQHGSLVVRDDPDNPAAEALRFTARMQYDTGDESHGVVVAVASARGGAGTSLIVANLGLALANAGMRVLVIDVNGQLGSFDDVPFSSVDELFAGARGWGSPAELEAGRASLLDALVYAPSPRGLALLAEGQMVDRDGNGAAASATLVPWGRTMSGAAPSDGPPFPAMRKLLAEARSVFDFVLVDSPPVLGMGASTDVLELADRRLLVVPHHQLVDDVEEVAARVELLSTSVDGYLYNRLPKYRWQRRNQLRDCLPGT